MIILGHFWILKNDMAALLEASSLKPEVRCGVQYEPYTRCRNWFVFVSLCWTHSPLEDLWSCKILTFLIRAALQHADEEVPYQHSCLALSQPLHSYYLRYHGMLAQSLPNLVLSRAHGSWEIHDRLLSSLLQYLIFTLFVQGFIVIA